MFDEDDLLPISALQHALYCERQFALIHIEQIWEENQFTAEGSVLHERIDAEHHESRRQYKVEYGMAIRSLRLGVIGKTDVVEFKRRVGGGYESIVPVEYKRGKNKIGDWDRVQLCAQALCLEEMFDTDIACGQFYYRGEHRRTEVDISSDLRDTTTALVVRTRELRDAGETPPATYARKKCDRCSLMDLCMPRTLSNGGRGVGRYIAAQLSAADGECG